MGRKKSNLTKCSGAIPFVAYETQLSDVVCPTIRKVTASGEIHLFDLASIQLELERILANVIERLQCLTAESKGKDVPSLVLTSFQQQQQQQATMCDSDANQSLSNGRPALMVKANPDKPLTLIISQRNRLSQLHQPVVHNSEATGSSRAKPFPNLMCGRRISRSSAEEHSEQNLSASPDKNQSASSYAVPNKFWELMEPYCAEITEANIGYLESLIRSYQDLETTYFQLPPLRSPDPQKFDHVESPAPKRPRRDLGNSASHHQQQLSAETTNDSEGHMNCSTNTSSFQLARYLESDLRKQPSESCALDRLSQSLLDSCYRENVVLSFTDSVNHVLEEYKTLESRHTTCCHENVETADNNRIGTSTGPEDHALVISSCSNGSRKDVGSSFPTIPDRLRHWVTAKASLPFKTLAKQMHVSSSFRVEKKIAQAMDELGLIPLNVIHPSQCGTQSSVAVKSENGCPFVPLFDASLNILDEKTQPDSVCLKLPLVKEQYENQSSTSRSHCPETAHVECAGLRRNSFSRNVRSLSTVSYTNVEVGELEPGRLRSSVVKSDESSCPPSNGPSELKSSRHRRSKKAGRFMFNRRLRNGLHSLHPRVNRQNGLTRVGERDVEAMPPDSSLASPTHPKDHLSNGIITSDDEDELVDSVENGLNVMTSGDTVRNHLSTANSRRRSADASPYVGETPDVSESRSFIRHNEGETASVVSGDAFHLNRLGPDTSETDTGECYTTDSGLDARTAGHNHSLEADGHIRHNSLNDTAVQSAHKSTLDGPVTTAHQSECPIGTCGSASGDHPSECKFDNAFTFLLHEFGQDRETMCKNLSINTITTDFGVICRTADRDLVAGDEVGMAILQRQQDLRLVCAQNHSVLRRLIQAARRDMQRQEIQRRLAIADADVIEAYNKLESYRPQRKPPLKRDRDMAYKALKERRKILKELEAFDSKSP